MEILNLYTEKEQVDFISDEVNHGIDYNDNKVGNPIVYTQMGAFLSEDNKVMPTIQQPFCRLNRH